MPRPKKEGRAKPPPVCTPVPPPVLPKRRPAELVDLTGTSPPAAKRVASGSGPARVDTADPSDPFGTGDADARSARLPSKQPHWKPRGHNTTHPSQSRSQASGTVSSSSGSFLSSSRDGRSSSQAIRLEDDDELDILDLTQDDDTAVWEAYGTIGMCAFCLPIIRSYF